MQGKLFTQDFLREGIQETDAWKCLDADELARFRARTEAIFGALPADSQANEAVTETEIIFPVLEALGWACLPQQTASGKGRQDVPDVLLFADAATKQAALAERRDEQRYRHGVAIVECKRWRRPLDRGDRADPPDANAPSNQMLRYLSRAEVASERAIRWGLLTNGRHWRLYFQGARSRSEEFLELDLALLAGMKGLPADLLAPASQDAAHFLAAFYLLFGPAGFVPQPGDPENRAFLAIALAETRRWEARVSQDLGEWVFERLFPRLVAAIAEHDPAASRPHTVDYLDAVRRAALILLYRLLFVLYAEDRNLLPIRDPRYNHYSLRVIRQKIARHLDANAVFSASAGRCYRALKDLFQIIGQGDAALGVPPYNGGLFDDRAHALLERLTLPDAVVAELIDGLSRRPVGQERRWINYRDLSVQQLGSIYERLLEYRVVSDDAGQIRVSPTVFARKGSGSYYTHDDLVQLLIRQTVGPLLDERADAFQRQVEALARLRSPKPQRLRDLQDHDPAAAILELKICDPAMGSGHFLVSLVDYLADQILERMADSTARVHWADAAEPYVSPLARRIADIRERILASSQAHGWTVDPAQLDDRHIVRRMILKRVIFGVDKNPMAVELAKVALWLHTFTVGAPLSFLDHHLRAGDALYGERIDRVLDELRAFGALFQKNELARIAVASASMNQIADLTDVDIAEVDQSRRLFEQIDTELAPLRKLLDFWQALRWLPAHDSVRQRGWADLASGRFGDVIDVIDAGSVVAGDPTSDEARTIQALLRQTRELAGQEGFLSWAIAFPTVWRHLDSGQPQGGFDAIIGNPPWDRMKLQEVEWFAARKPEIAHAVRAADRKRLIGQLEKAGDSVWLEYQQAGNRAETAARIARDSGDYPLLSGGDVNLYALFVERAQSLVNDRGIVGLLTPSGIASDKGSSAFFKSIATTGRLAALLDFENRKGFFPDVDSRFKFCALVFGGVKRTFPETRCAFFLHAVAELDESQRFFALSAEDFAAVNPNTGTAPIFRYRRDAEITRAIYGRCPVLMDRRTDPPRQVWPVRYLRMFDMTNDSHLFKRRDELEAAGFYPVGGHRWRKGKDEYVPLYEGKMVQGYDHRAASIAVNPANLHRPAQPEPASLKQHQDVNWLPEPQFWIDRQQVETSSSIQWTLAFKDVTAPTNMRTMIAMIVGMGGFGNTLPVLLPEGANGEPAYRRFTPLLLANLNSFVFDFIARQKVQGQHLNLYIVEQIPVIPPHRFEAAIGDQTIADFIRAQVLRLSYTAVDLRPFAADMGYEGEPFVWDENDRRHRLARLDALFFHLYGLDRNDADYVLAQFPIVREQDEKQFGRYLTRDLILAYLNAVAAGDLETVVEVR
ncbi:MAG: restriction endonuclease [Candidatus Competibacter sp.]|nr:restriction endonuclease [Candidatus Competibacter sp.]